MIEFFQCFGLCMKAGKLAYGADMCIDKIKYKKAKIIILAKDSSQNTIEKFERICSENNVKIYKYGSKADLSFAIRKTK